MFTGVPWKGRNFRKASKEALKETFYDPEFLADRFNGRSKQEAKSEDLSEEFLEEVSRPGWSEVGRFVNTGRKSARFGFDAVETREGTVEGYRSRPFDSGFDEVFVPDDLGVEGIVDGPIDVEPYAEGSSGQVYLGENSTKPGEIELGEVLRDYIDGYRVSGSPVDSGVSLSAMVSEELEDQEIEKVLVSRDLENISKSIADYTWEGIERQTFQDYARELGVDEYDEEELIGSEPQIGGVYIVDSGTTADRQGLDYQRIGQSYLRNWQASPDNSFKELERTKI